MSELPNIGAYVLDENKNPVPCDVMTFTLKAVLNSFDKFVGRDTINGKLVSTVFLGINHNLVDDSQPILFETMVFKDLNGFDDIYRQRYHTWKEAEAGHKIAVQWVLDGCKDD